MMSSSPPSAASPVESDPLLVARRPSSSSGRDIVDDEASCATLGARGDDDIVSRLRYLAKARWTTLLSLSFVALAVCLLGTYAANQRPATSSTSSIGSVLLRHQHRSSSSADDDGSSTSSPPEQQAPRRYAATQFISFTINTLGGLESYGECDGRQVDPNTGTCYLGNANNLTEDVYHRLALVEEVLNVIRSDLEQDDETARGGPSHEIDRRTDVLKIFAMPEFFLRGPHGAYSISDLLQGGILLDVADRIRDIIADDVFSDFLFVFGTVIAARSPDDPGKPWEHAMEKEDVEFYNFAPVYKGGMSHRHRYLVEKQYVSNADFLSRTNLPNPNPDLYAVNASGALTYDDTPDVLRALLMSRDVQLVEDSIINLDGLRIGIEICLDHRLGTLWSNLRKKQQQQQQPRTAGAGTSSSSSRSSNPKPEPDLVDVLLVTSAGMAIERGPNPIVPGGVVYLSDGMASSAACLRSDNGRFDPNRVCRDVDIDGLKHIRQPFGGGRSGGGGGGGDGTQPPPSPNGYYSEFFTVAACIDVDARTSLLEGYYSLHQTQGCANTLKLFGIDVMDEFAFYPPSIEIYPTVDLPAKAYK